MRRLSKSIAIVATSLMVSSVPPVLAFDSADEITAARQKINLSGRQRMLSQRMTSAVCMAVTGADPARAEVAMAAVGEFDTALAGLKDGNDSLGLTVETDLGIREGIETVEGTWSIFQVAAQQLLAGDLSSTTLNTILSMNLQLLSQSNDVVVLFEKAYGASVIDEGMAATINVAGRQRMLSQRMTKELCFVAADFDRSANQESLQKTIALFDSSLDFLMNGDAAASIVPPPNPDVLIQLTVVETIWDDVKPIMEAASSGGAPNVGDLAAIAAMTDKMLVEMNKAVQMYVASS